MNLLGQLRLGLTAGFAKVVTWSVRSLGLGAGSVLPGEIATRIYPNLLPTLFKQVRQGVILVVGTNGKTTTSSLLRTILAKTEAQVIHNETGANLINGLTTALLESTNWLGEITADYAILEVDENVLPLVLKKCQPKIILGLNLFRDQLDRYGEVDAISQRWQEAIVSLPKETLIVLNGDDPTLSYLGQQLPQKVLFFGLSEPELYLDEVPHAVDSIYCPSCGASLEYEGLYLSHLGDFHCPSCNFTKSSPALNSKEWPQILIGVYNKYNTIAAGLVAQELGISTSSIYETVRNFRAAFGRSEELYIDGKHVRILLSKNPVGMNETIRAVKQIQSGQENGVSLLVLNDQIPDGTDVSWIWDVDMDKLTTLGGKIIVSGDRVYDLALRLKYIQEMDEKQSPCNFELIVEEDLKQAIATALHSTPKEQTLHILPTYSAMLEVRQLLTGRKIR
jgi:UDP-N-acetylmuramyl tripeptide synthase